MLGMNDSSRADTPVRDDQQPRRDDGWASAPAATPPGQQAQSGQYGQQSQYGQYGQPDHFGAPGPAGPTPWYGAAARPGRSAAPKPPWFWPVIAVVVGLAALSAGGGVGFAIGHAIGSHQSQSGTQLPGRGTNEFPGQGGGTGQLPGQGTENGTGSGTGTGTGTDGSAPNS